MREDLPRIRSSPFLATTISDRIVVLSSVQPLSSYGSIFLFSHLPLALSLTPRLLDLPCYICPNVSCLFNSPHVILLTNPHHIAHYSIVRMRSVACHT